MIYLNKFLSKIKEDCSVLKRANLVLMFGLTSTQIKDLKKYALENEFIIQSKEGCFLTPKSEKYLLDNPLVNWNTKEYSLRPEINLEYLKDEKIPAVLTKAIRNYAKFLIDNQPLKEFSLESALDLEIKSFKKIITKLEADILCGKRISINNIYQKYLTLGLTKSIIFISLLVVIVNNLDKIAIYEKSQFQLKFDQLMFDRMIACPENFELQKTELENEYLLKDISKIILNKKSNNILEITKGLYKEIKKLDKYTMNTESLDKNTIRLRNVILNAKDPMNLFERDIPKVFGYKTLQECDRQFLNDLKNSLNELKNCTDNLIKKIKEIFFKYFFTDSKENLSERFIAIKEFINDKELKVLFNTISDLNVSDELWINRIATFINKSRVPKDWSDEDFADFKLKAKESALKFSIIEATTGSFDFEKSQSYNLVFNGYLNLNKQEQLMFLRKAANTLE